MDVKRDLTGFKTLPDKYWQLAVDLHIVTLTLLHFEPSRPGNISPDDA